MKLERLKELAGMEQLDESLKEERQVFEKLKKDIQSAVKSLAKLGKTMDQAEDEVGDFLYHVNLRD